MIAGEQKRNSINSVQLLYQYIRFFSYFRFRTNESFLILRFGKLTKLVNDSNTELEKTLGQILWQYDLYTYFLHRMNFYNEIKGKYNWQIIITVKKLIYIIFRFKYFHFD